MILPTLILAIMASFSAGGYSMLQEYLQQQTTSDTEKAQAHLTDCRNHSLENIVWIAGGFITTLVTMELAWKLARRQTKSSVTKPILTK